MQLNPLSKHILFIVSVTCLRLSAISTNTVRCRAIKSITLTMMGAKGRNNKAF